MRLTTVIILLAIMQVSASSYAQKLNYVKKNVPLLQFFKEIKKQTGYNVVWNEEKLDVTNLIDVNFKNAELEDALTVVLKKFPLTYTISKKTIILKEKEPSFLDKVIDHFSTINVRGRVTDSEGNPLIGATVKVKGTNILTVTGDNGKFNLDNLDSKAVLVLSYLGYDSMEITVSENIGNITLESSTGSLKEVEVNAGYYTVTDKERTGSISRINKKEIEKQPVNNVLMALSGNVSGLQITQSNGVPGSGFSVRIRGQNSIRSGQDPLFIMDGVIYPSSGISSSGTTGTSVGDLGVSPLSLINPNDIESVEILKDADATAIYGSRGANGVILITTKKGIQGKARVNATILQGVQEVNHKIKLLNTPEYLAMRREALKNDALTPSGTDYDVNGTWSTTKYTDWQKQLIGGTAPTTNVALDIGGGSPKSNYLISGNFYREGTVFPGEFGFKRIGIRSNISLGSAEDRFYVSFSGSFNHTESNLANFNISSIFLPPNAPDPYDQYGKLNWENNTVLSHPTASLLRTSDAKTDNLNSNVTLSYRILPSLVFKTSIGYSSIKRLELVKTPLTSWPTAYNFTSIMRSSQFGNNYINSLIAEPQLNFNTKIGSGAIQALLGMSLQSNESQINVINASNFNSDDLLENIGSAGTLQSGESEYSQYRYLGVFARINYDLHSKYILNLTARRDGSSKFGPGKQYANFGAIGAAWIFSSENLISENLHFLSFGKLRVSYGITGNDQISNYGYLQLWNSGESYQNTPTLIPSVFGPNANFAWETNRKLEAALQLSFLHNRLNIEFSNYRNRSSNQLLLQNLPLSAGPDYIYRNLAAKIQNTGWEIDADFKALNKTNLKWTIELNLSIPRNKLLSYPNLENSNDAINYSIGKPLNILKTYNVNVDSKTGMYIFEDKNTNGTIDDGDRYIVKNLNQTYIGGIQNSLSYKQFNLSFNFTFTKQNGLSYRSIAFNPGLFIASGINSNQFSEVLNRWQQPEDHSQTQKFSTTFPNNDLNYTASRYGNISVVDASFIRLRNVSISYSLPKNIISFLKVNDILIRLQGQNLFTITNYIGLDPENQGISLPPLRVLTMGINVIF